MSHIAEIEVQIRDGQALKDACKRIGATYIGKGQHRLFVNNVDGVAVQLPGWQYPVVVQSSGKLAYDNFNGAWGDESQLQKLKQAYGAEAAKRQMRKQGFSVQERTLANGQVRLVCQKA